MNQRSPSEIERDLERTRAEMTRTIDAIQDRLSPGQLFEQGLRYVSSGGGSLTGGATRFAENLGRAVRDNPVPFALVTTGLVWLMVANSRPRYDHDEYPDYDALEDYDDYSAMEPEPVEGDWPAHYGTGDEDRARREREREAETVAPAASATVGTPGAAPRAEEAPPYRGGLGGSVGAASVGEQRAQEAARQAEVASGTERGDHDREATRRAHEAAEEARRQAVRAGQATEENRRRTGGGARERAEAAREWAGERAQDARARMHRATEDARRRAGRASRATRHYTRDTAYTARRRARRAGSDLARLFEERPLLIGAIGLAIGAALGAALPATRREDEWFGDTRDDLKHRARAEYGKAERVAERAYRTARDEAEREGLTPEGARRAAREAAREAERAAEQRMREAARDAEQAVEERVHDVEGRMRRVGEAVTEAAKDEASRQNLGGGSGSSSREPGGPERP